MVEDRFDPRVQRPPPPPPVSASLEDLEEWNAVLSSEIKKCWEVLQHHQCRSVCHKYGNTTRCCFLFPHEIVEVSHFDAETSSVVLMCKDGSVNYFNPYILVFCRHNHDIKCVLSGKGAKAAMFYISDYITKMDVKTYEVLSLLSRAVAHIPETVSLPGNVVDHGKALLHKCLSQFNHQQQVHAQQAARYIQGFDDSCCSHQTVPMMSSLLLAYVKEHYIHHDVLAPEEEDDDIEIEPVRLRISTDKDGHLVEANQIHHYIYRADALAAMNFYEFCRCVRIETINRSSKMKHTYETRTGVYRRHALKEGHPSYHSHQLIEHTNEERGDGFHELVPRVVGMSIPRSHDATAWAIFALAHFKPFSISCPLLGSEDTALDAYKAYDFCSCSCNVMANWEAIHECEDEWDADRLRKQVSLTAESKALSLSMGLASIDEDIEIDMSHQPSHQPQEDFHIHQMVLLMQECRWLAHHIPKAQLTTADTIGPVDPPSTLSMLHDSIGTCLKHWKREVKNQETTIALTRRNALNPQSQVAEVCDAAQDIQHGTNNRQL